MRAESILFVCTGNTCRSPMAEAVARHLLGALAEKMRIESAGVHASIGERMTPEAQRALKALGIPAREHRSRGLTLDVVQRADVIYCMSASHLSAVVRVWPPARGKTHLLDPAGGDIADPIGMSLADYTQTAQRLVEFVGVRLREAHDGYAGGQA